MIHELIALRKAEPGISRAPTPYSAPTLFTLVDCRSSTSKVQSRIAAAPANNNNVVLISTHLRYSRRR
jgi:hypothetical protein